MAQVPVFSSLDDKSKIFTTETFETKDQVGKFLEGVCQDTTSYWRGTESATHKLYTTLQRFWIKNDMPVEPNAVHDYIEKINSAALEWQGGAFRNYIEHSSGEKYPSIFSMLAVLRHHGTPAPYTDWSRNPLVGLYFMSQGDTCESVKPIENYCSLYQVSNDHMWFSRNVKSFSLRDEEYQALQHVSRSDPQQLEQMAIHLKIGEELLDDRMAVERAFAQNTLMRYSQILSGAVFRIEDQPTDPYKWGINNNLNIINQEGLFVYNGHPTISLEESTTEMLNSFAKQPDSITSQVSIGDRGQKAVQTNKEVKCYNFHRRLCPYILKKISEGPKPITQAYLFPNLYDMADHVLNEYRSN